MILGWFKLVALMRRWNSETIRSSGRDELAKIVVLCGPLD